MRGILPPYAGLRFIGFVVLLGTGAFSHAAIAETADSPPVSTARESAGVPAEANSTAPQNREPQASSQDDPRDRILFSSETESFKPLVGKLTRNVLMDEKQIFTSPFRINRDNAKWWLLFGGTAGALISADRYLSRQLPNTNDQLSFSRNVSQLGAGYTVVPVAAGFYLYGALKDDPKARETGALGAEALVDSLITVEVLKLVFNRERPLEGSGNGRFFEWGHNGFPSGHAMLSFSLASVVAHEYAAHKLVPVLAYGLATVVSASRFSARKHYASDIIAGGAIGWFIGRYVFQTHVDHMIHHRSPGELRSLLRPRIIPRIEPVSRTYGVSLAWGGAKSGS